MNFSSEEWNQVAREISARLEELDLQNRNPHLDYVETVGIRGEIQGLLWLLDWPKRQEALKHGEGESYGPE